MEKPLKYTLIGLGFMLQSCLFGAELYYKSLPGDYFLFANSTMDEMSIWRKTGKNSNMGIVSATVFAVGYSEDFIISKNHPNNVKIITHYHIINVRNDNAPLKSVDLTLEQFELVRKWANVPDTLSFQIVFRELE